MDEREVRGRRYVFCGSRGWVAAEPIRRRLEALPEGAIVVVGGARGADRIAEEEARKLGLAVEVHPARWEEEGRGAGYRRNERMAALPNVAGVYAFRMPGESRGTDHMIATAKKRGIAGSVVSPRPS